MYHVNHGHKHRNLSSVSIAKLVAEHLKTHAAAAAEGGHEDHINDVDDDVQFHSSVGLIFSKENQESFDFSRSV